MQILPALAVMVMVAPIDAVAQDNPVVLELFTSQGCISCPPADALLAELAQDKDVLPLALHVTYWDFLGWRDSFGQEAFTQRQKAYARTLRKRTLYTPQMIVEGRDMLVGHDQNSITQRIAEHRSQPVPVDLTVSRSEGRLHLKLAPRGGAVGPADIELVRFEPTSEVEIEAGENAGQTITYTNVVTDWQTVARWDGAAGVELDFDGVGEGPMAVIVQSVGLGPILTAAKLD